MREPLINDVEGDDKQPTEHRKRRPKGIRVTTRLMAVAEHEVADQPAAQANDEEEGRNDAVVFLPSVPDRERANRNGHRKKGVLRGQRSEKAKPENAQQPQCDACKEAMHRTDRARHRA